MDHRTQAERSAATRQRLVDAAIGLLVRRGWAATTAVAVCGEAGVTRGALMHHYPDLGGLLADALDRLYDEMLSRVGEPATTVQEAVEAGWAAVSDRRFKAVLEAWWAAGNDPLLAAQIAPVVARFSKLVSPDNAASAALRRPASKVFLLTARETLLGLAMGRATSGGRPLPHESTVLSDLRARAAVLDRGPARPRSPKEPTS